MIGWHVAGPLMATGFGLVAALMFVLWLLHFPLKNAAIVDVGWGTALAMLATAYAVMGPGWCQRKWLLAATVIAYAARLSGYLFFTRIWGHPEEGRYVELRRQWGSNVELRFLGFYEMQAVLATVLSLPFLAAALNPQPSMQGRRMGCAAALAAGQIGRNGGRLPVVPLQVPRRKRRPGLR